MIRVTNDLLRAVDSNGGAILVLLDLSAAFDTIDHDVLLKALETQCGIVGTVLKWFASYLSNRRQAVKIGAAISSFVSLAFGVPQGSVLGPILFTLYTTPLGEIIKRHGLNFHLYADDTQLYILFRPKDAVSQESARAKIEACAEDIRRWMNNNLLKLNEDKTELIIITSNHTNSSFTIKIGNDTISPSDEIPDPPKNLGVYFDKNLSFVKHLKKVVGAINFAFYNIGKIRKYLDRPSCESLINGLTCSRLNYCNTLFYGAP